MRSNGRYLPLFGPPEIGKTHLAIAFGHSAARFSLSRLSRSDLVIIDETGYTPIERTEANHFFTFVSDLYERAAIVITGNKGFDTWAELLGDPVMTRALLDRLMHHAKIVSLSGESFRISSQKQKRTPQGGENHVPNCGEF